MNRLLSQRIRNHRLAWLFDPNEPTGGTTVTDPPAPAGDGTGTEPTGGDSGGSAEPTAATVSMTQAELDKLIARSHAKGASAAEKKIGDYLTAESQTAEQRAASERDAANRERDEARAEALQARVESTANAAALTAKVDPARVGRFLKLVDLSDTTTDGRPDQALITAAIAKTLSEFPEFASGTPAPAGASGGEFTNNGGAGHIWTRAEIAKIAGTPEWEKHADEITKQMQAGLIKQ